jgi:PAS domain S-box-containing protein
MSVTTDDRLATALQGTGDGACAIGPDGKVVIWNAAAERLLGYSAREAIGRRCCDLFAGYDGDGNPLCDADCHVKALVRHDEPVRAFDMRARTKAGHPVWLNVSVIAVPPRTVHLLRDVTATKELLALVHERNGADAAPPDLTRRELEILRLLTQGLNTAGAAERLHVSRATVRNHVQNIFAKLGVHSRLEAVAHAARHRLF